MYGKLVKTEIIYERAVLILPPHTTPKQRLDTAAQKLHVQSQELARHGSSIAWPELRDAFKLTAVSLYFRDLRDRSGPQSASLLQTADNQR